MEQDKSSSGEKESRIRTWLDTSREHQHRRSRNTNSSSHRLVLLDPQREQRGQDDDGDDDGSIEILINGSSAGDGRRSPLNLRPPDVTTTAQAQQQQLNPSSNCGPSPSNLNGVNAASLNNDGSGHSGVNAASLNNHGPRHNGVNAAAAAASLNNDGSGHSGVNAASLNNHGPGHNGVNAAAAAAASLNNDGQGHSRGNHVPINIDAPGPSPKVTSYRPLTQKDLKKSPIFKNVERDEASTSEDDGDRNDPDFRLDDFETASAGSLGNTSNSSQQQNVSGDIRPPVTKKKQGKQYGVIWDSFEVEKDSNRKPSSAKCKLCGQKVSPRSKRLKSHTASCSKSNAGSKLGNNSRFAFADQRPPANADPGKALQVRQTNIRSHIRCLTEDEIMSINKKLGRFVYAANLPFHAVEYPEFMDFVRSLNPAYKSPSERVLSGSILNTVYDECRRGMKEKAEGKNVCLLQDEWTTNQNEGVVAHTMATGTDTFFLQCQSTEDNKQDKNYFADLFGKAKIEAESEMRCTVVGYCVDNCATMVAAKKVVAQRFPDVEAYGCHSHLANLLGEHFTPKETMEKVVFVQKFMKKSRYPKARLKKMKKKAPVVPGATRWNSGIDTAINYMENEAAYLSVFREMIAKKLTINKEKRKRLNDILNDREMYKQVGDMIKVLSPICRALDAAQRKDATLADAIEGWRKMYHELPLTIVNDDYFKKQLEVALTGVAIATHMLHPKYQGDQLPMAWVSKGYEWITSKSDLLLKMAAQLKSNDDKVFFKAFLKKEHCTTMHPVTWWKSAMHTLPQKEGEILEKVFALPASTAGVERNFSTLGSIITKQRNRLCVEKAKKLCFIVNFFKFCHREFLQDVERKRPRRDLINDSSSDEEMNDDESDSDSDVSATPSKRQKKN